MQRPLQHMVAAGNVVSDQELATLCFPAEFQAFSPNLSVKLYAPCLVCLCYLH